MSSHSGRFAAFICAALLIGWGRFAGVTAVYADSDDRPADDYPRLSFNHRGPAGRVRAMAFADSPNRLYVAGDDKVVDVFFLTGDVQQPPTTTHATTLRWETSRGALGQIYALALSERRELLAMGGFSARNSGGDLALFQSDTARAAGVLPASIRYSSEDGARLPQNCHLSSVTALAMSPSGNRLISSDSYAATRVWDVSDYASQNVDSSIFLRGPHTGHYTNSRFPVLMTGDQYAMTAEPADWKAPPSVNGKWSIYYYDLEKADGQSAGKFRILTRLGRVESLERSSDGRFFAACFDPTATQTTDTAATAFVWKTGGQPKPIDVSDLTVVRLTFGTDDGLFVTGLRRSDQRPVIRILRCANFPADNDFQQVQEFEEDSSLGAADIISASRDGQFLARSSARQQTVAVYRLKSGPLPTAQTVVTPPARLASIAARYLSAVCSADNRYRVALSSNYANFDPSQADFYFDFGAMGPRRDSRIRRSQWNHPNGFTNEWTLTAQGDGGLQIKNSDGSTWRLQLRPEQGRPTARCRFTSADGRQHFVAIATTAANGIYVYRLPANGSAVHLVRYFRDHTAAISSLNVSGDGSTLVSTSLDRTIKLWNLNGITDSGPTSLPEQRYGAKFRDAGPDGLVITTLQSTSILAARGFMPETRVSQLHYKRTTADLQGETAESGETMLAALIHSPPEMELVIGGTQPSGETFETRFSPGWEPLVTLYITKAGDWVCVTPTGYFAASDGDGDELITWQQSVRRAEPIRLASGRELSDQFRRPELLQDLIAHQDLPQALLNAGRSESESLTKTGAALSAAFRSAPTVRLTEPGVGRMVKAGGSVLISAVVDLPPLANPAGLIVDAYVNGQSLGRKAALPDASQDRVALNWSTPPVSQVNRVRVVLKRTGDEVSSVYKFAESAFVSTMKPELPKIHSLVVGANDYSGVLPPLKYARQDAESVGDMIRKLTDDQHRGVNVLLTDSTPVVVSNNAILTAIERLSTAIQSGKGPQQLMVFLAGHGKQLDDDGQYYFLPPDVTTFADVTARGVSWKAFAALAELPCRKLFIVDTCDSGSVASYVAAGRATQQLSDSQIVVIAATAETGTARELVGFEHGALTQCLIEGIQQGKADGALESESRDRIVTLREVAEYVQQRLPTVTEDVHGTAQRPTVAPADLLNIQSFPLSVVVP